ncbi:EH signature domain-containing protein [Thalassotalea sp. SU-HH00458]|uniref:EH signature domain-containing protein n=1 Tax=Thalassotalea sp. SU-HH00458 TaxID=3127657 RepID=UPI00310345DE
MFAKSALQSLDVESWNKPPALRESLLAKASNDITKVTIDSDIQAPSKSSLQQIYTRLKLAFETKNVSSLSRYDINHSPWVLFEHFDEDKPLIKRWRFMNFYKNLTNEVDNYRFIMAFYNAYLVSYPYKEKYINDIQNHIKSLFNNSKNKKVARLSVEILRRNTLDTNAHSALIQNVIRTGKIGLELKSRGLLEGLSSSKFTLTFLSHYLSNFKENVTSSSFNQKMTLISNLIEFSELEDKLRYPEFRIETADSILTSLHHIQIQPVVKDALKTFFLTHYGDPRVELSGWHGVSDEARRVFQSWLVEKTMEDFFNLLSHVADTQSDSDRHWRYRKRFWNAYLKKGYIEEAWFALGHRAYEQAPNFIKGKHNYSSLSGGDSRHSVLIMKIGDLILTEWSHSGSYRVWNSTQYAPAFYEKHYNRDDVIANCDHTGAHHGNETGGWQERLSTHIRDLTGLRVLAKDYMND